MTTGSSREAAPAAGTYVKDGFAVENARGLDGSIPEGDMTEHLRWVAVVTYRSEHGPIEVDHHFEELSELDALIERGPDWSTIIEITIRLKSARRATHPDDTVERAVKR
jgi:hypothetical protein